MENVHNGNYESDPGKMLSLRRSRCEGLEVAVSFPERAPQKGLKARNDFVRVF
jgi:hypothetical protein